MFILSAMLCKILNTLWFLEVCSECSAETAEEENEVDEIIWEEIVLVVNVLVVERETQAGAAVFRDESEGAATEPVVGTAGSADEEATQAETADIVFIWYNP